MKHTAEGSNYLKVCERSEIDGVKDAGLALDGIRHVMEQENDDFYLEYPCHSPDQKRWFGMRVKRFEGERSMVVVEHQEITERKLAEKSALDHKELLVEAQKLAKLGNWNFDAVSSEFYWSEGMKTMHGLPLEHIPSAEMSAKILHPEDRERVLNEMTLSRSEGVNVSSVYRIIRADTKQERTVRSTTDVEMDENGTLMRMFGIVEDITELHHAELERDELIDQLEQRVAERTAELTSQNKDILDSINYAKRIQTGILSPESEVESIFADSFVLSYPRDIVSGDFFWVHERHERKYIVVADCTGHGVPGALMSIIGNNLLNQIIIEERYNDPSIILGQLDARLKRAIRGDHGELQDGMDLVLCVIDGAHYELHYAGALRPLFITDDEGKIQEMKPDRQAIGGRLDEGRKQFATKRSLIIHRQRIYLTSDGYYSQFGGPNDKKYMKSRFKNTLEAIQSRTMEEQKELLRDALTEWAGTNEQVDDILVVGIEL